MGASNFYNKNASKVYAVGMSHEEKYSICSECEEKHYEYDGELLPEGSDCPDCEAKGTIKHETEDKPIEDWEYQDLKDYIKETLAESDNYEDGGEDDSDRNYYGVSMGYLSKSKSFGDIEVEVKIQAMLRSAYYEGANLDYEDVTARINGYDDIDVENVKGDIEDYTNSDMSAGMVKIQAKNAAKWAEKTATELTNELEEIFTKISMPLNVVARFSNGETVYEKAKG